MLSTLGAHGTLFEAHGGSVGPMFSMRKNVLHIHSKLKTTTLPIVTVYIKSIFIAFSERVLALGLCRAFEKIQGKRTETYNNSLELPQRHVSTD